MVKMKPRVEVNKLYVALGLTPSIYLHSVFTVLYKTVRDLI